ncbi:MAG TPA: aspartate--tRNA ligase [Aquifex aeolicus]|uniref:Aspartate--tRNA(Asp/Asn) ligase n=1 Tax=Aquifex aeolicus TaxID=63363 RepID=A0A9D0YNZ2_AQUAO|nr:aspartate--tRNA ligase [Aquifex aeolicus]
MLTVLGNFRRTHYCGEINENNIDQSVRLVGWVDTVRNHGGVVFIDLRDRSGIVQVVVEELKNPEAYEIADKVKPEYVIAVEGKVRRRPEGTENPKLPTGFVEVVADKVLLLNTAHQPLPFQIEDEIKVNEEVRLRYRYLDLRRRPMLNNLLLRHKTYQVVRNFLTDEGFIEVETPLLTKSTPEGARDFIVPSRLHPGKFYALPQSPQLFKQILMVAGLDKYFQIAKCLRDEDLRADRQPEFTQIDLEMSFVGREDVMNLTERLVKEVFKQVAGIEIDYPLPIYSYEEVMSKYGSDKPDLRIREDVITPLIELTDIFKNTQFKVFKNVVDKGGIIKAVVVKGGAKTLSRQKIDELTKFVQKLGAKGLAWIRVDEDKLTSPITKFFSKEEIENLLNRCNAQVGDIIFFQADSDRESVYKVLDALRRRLADELKAREEGFKFLWVVDFPLLEWDKEEERFVSVHHPFTMPREEDLLQIDRALNTKDIEERKEILKGVKSLAYDMVLNGEEIGGGSIRIHRTDIQEKIFKLLGIGAVEAEEKFGFLLEALKYGAPPHGGFAFGLDRLLAIMVGADSIREVIAFPKTQKGICPLTNAPDYVDPKQLKEVHCEVERREEE